MSDQMVMAEARFDLATAIAEALVDDGEDVIGMTFAKAIEKIEQVLASDLSKTMMRNCT